MISYNSNKMLEQMHASQYTNIATRYADLYTMRVKMFFSNEETATSNTISKLETNILENSRALETHL